VYDLEMFRGNNRVFSLAVQRDGRPLDISGATFRFLVRKSVGDAPSAAVITKTTGAGLAISDAPNGIVDITFVPSDTNPLYAPQVLIFDIEMTLSGEITTPVQGTLLVQRTITP